MIDQGAGSLIYAPLYGLDKALESQGGIKGPERVRDDAGLYLYHDVGEYLSRYQTYQVETASAPLNVVNGFASTTNPDAVGLRFGRFLISAHVQFSSATGVVAGGVLLDNSGIQPDFPIMSNGAVVFTFAATLRTINTNVLVPVVDNSPFKFPMWCPPGTLMVLLVNGNAAGGTATLYAHWLTTELKNAAGVPTGDLRAPIMR